MNRLGAIGLWLALIGGTAPAMAADHVSGPVLARVERVIDGDTFEARALVWPGTEMVRKVRARGIDAPEIHRARCPRERVKGEEARAYLADLVGGKSVLLSDIGDDKYGGRVDARVTTLDGRDVGALLMANKLADPMGHRPRERLCALTARD